MNYRYMFRLLVIVALYCNFSVSVLAQLPVGGCEAMFRKAYDELRISADDHYAISYSIDTELNTAESNKADVEIKVDDLNAFVQYGDRRIFRDDKATVFIDDKREVIYIADAPDVELSELRFDKLAQLQDSLLQSNLKLTCSSAMDSEHGKTTKVTLGSANEILPALDIEKMSYWLDQDGQDIKAMKLEYTADHPQLKTVKITLRKIDRDYQGKPFNGAALEQVYREDGNLIDDYSQYKVINTMSGQPR